MQENTDTNDLCSTVVQYLMIGGYSLCICVCVSVCLWSTQLRSSENCLPFPIFQSGFLLILLQAILVHECFILLLCSGASLWKVQERQKGAKILPFLVCFHSWLMGPNPQLIKCLWNMWDYGNFYHPKQQVLKNISFPDQCFLICQPHFYSLKQTQWQSTDLQSTISASDPWWERSAFSAGSVVGVHKNGSSVSILDIWQKENCSSLHFSPKCLHMTSSFYSICWLAHLGRGNEFSPSLSIFCWVVLLSEPSFL